MPRVPRSALPDGYFHVFSRSVAETPLYRDDADRGRFVGYLRACERAHRWTCHAFCLMTTHYHLVVESNCGALSRGLQALNGRYARSFNRRHGRFGHLFAERFSARAIGDDEYLVEACAYVLQNPVKAGLCDRTEEWPWSFSSFGLDAT